jgi:hypothetical protein
VAGRFTPERISLALKAELAFFGFSFRLAFFLTDLVQIEIGSKACERAGSRLDWVIAIGPDYHVITFAIGPDYHVIT